MVEVLELPWSQGIDNSAEQNIASLGRIFNSHFQNQPS